MPIMTNILYLLANLFRTYVIFMLCSSIWGNFKGNRKYEFMAYMPFYIIVYIFKWNIPAACMAESMMWVSIMVVLGELKLRVKRT